MKLVASRPIDETVSPENEPEDPFAAFASESAPPTVSVATPSADPARLKFGTWSGRQTRRVLIVVCSIIVVAAAGAAVVREFRSRTLAPPPTGRLTVMSHPSGAEVFVDGLRRGVAPLTVELSPGPHKLALRNGAASREFSIVTRPDVEVVHNADVLAPPNVTGSLSLTSEPSGMRIVVDKEPRGATPATIDGLAPGVHAVVLTGTQGTTERRVDVRSGTTTSLHIAAGQPSALPPVGSVVVSAPIDVQLFQGDTLVGTSRSARLFMPAGTQSLTAVNETLGFRRTLTFTVSAGGSTRVAVQVPSGTLSVNARPWAEVFVDGVSLGETPIGNHALPIGSHELVLKHPELGERRQAVVIAVGRTARVGVDFRQ